MTIFSSGNLHSWPKVAIAVSR